MMMCRFNVSKRKLFNNSCYNITMGTIEKRSKCRKLGSIVPAIKPNFLRLGLFLDLKGGKKHGERFQGSLDSESRMAG